MLSELGVTTKRYSIRTHRGALMSVVQDGSWCIAKEDGENMGDDAGPQLGIKADYTRLDQWVRCSIWSRCKKISK